MYLLNRINDKDDDIAETRIIASLLIYRDMGINFLVRKIEYAFWTFLPWVLNNFIEIKYGQR